MQKKDCSSFWAGFPAAQVNEEFFQTERPLQPVRKIVIKGAVDVFFKRASVPRLVVAGNTQEAIKAVKTTLKDDRLVIENHGFSINFGASGGVHYSTGAGAIHIGSIGGSLTVNGKKVFVNENEVGRAVVGIELPDIPSLAIKGSGAVTLLDLQQAGIEIEISGSGSVVAGGHVAALNVLISGSGDVDARTLIAHQVHLSISGAGDIRARASDSALVQISGCGDVVVHGNPPNRRKLISGCGEIRFK